MITAAQAREMLPVEHPIPESIWEGIESNAKSGSLKMEYVLSRRKGLNFNEVESWSQQLALLGYEYLFRELKEESAPPHERMIILEIWWSPANFHNQP